MNKTEDDTDYRPIACDVYSKLELAILRRQRLRLTWHKDNIIFMGLVIPLDLETQAGREYLHFDLSSGEHTRIRLDYIDGITPA